MNNRYKQFNNETLYDFLKFLENKIVKNHDYTNKVKKELKIRNYKPKKENKELENNGYFVIEPDNKGIRYIDKNNNWQLAKNWNEYKNYWRSIMRTIETKVYKFDELNNTAKENAIDRLRDINVDYEWWEDDFVLDIELPKKILNKIDNGYVMFNWDVMFNWERIYFNIDRNRYIQAASKAQKAVDWLLGKAEVKNKEYQKV